MEGRDDLANRLEEAVLNNNPGDIFAIANEGGDVNGSTQSGDSVIHLAARAGNCSSIAALGDLEANLEVVNSTNATPLEDAIKNNRARSVRALLAAGAKVDKRLVRGDTYLHIAADGGHSGALEVLLERGMDANIKNHLNETPLFRAVRAGNVRGVEMLLEKGADAGILPEGGKSLLEVSVESQNVNMFKFFMKDGRNFKSKVGDTVCHLVAQDNQGTTAMMAAVSNSKEDVVKFMLHNGADPNIKDREGRTALHYAAEGGCAGSAASLLLAGARVDELDIIGETPALVAAANNKPAVLQLLVEKGADLSLKYRWGDGILHRMARSGQLEAVRVLLDAGAEVDMRGFCQRTALHLAAKEGHVEVARALLDRGADLAAKDLEGNTALIRASYHGHLAVVQLLVGRGAPLNDRDSSGWSALRCANIYKRRAIADYLRSRGGVE